MVNIFCKVRAAHLVDFLQPENHLCQIHLHSRTHLPVYTKITNLQPMALKNATNREHRTFCDISKNSAGYQLRGPDDFFKEASNAID